MVTRPNETSEIVLSKRDLREAAQSLGMDPGRSVVVTDTLGGVVLGLGVGFRVVFVGVGGGGGVPTSASVTCVACGEAA